MNEKFIKIDKKLNLVFRGLIHVTVIALLIVSILGYVFSYDEMKVYIQNENAIPSLIHMFIITNVVFIGFVGAFSFIICHEKFNLKNVLTIILVVPVGLLTLVGYMLSAEYLTVAYDCLNYFFVIFFIVVVYLVGMYTMLMIMDDKSKSVKDDITESTEVIE